jgi:hypothetical protein
MRLAKASGRSAQIADRPELQKNQVPSLDPTFNPKTYEKCVLEGLLDFTTLFESCFQIRCFRLMAHVTQAQSIEPQ